MGRKLIFAVVALLSVCCVLDARAQQGPPRAGEDRPQRPAGQALKVEPVSPELDRLLKQWEVASARIQKLEGKHHRFVYDQVFCVEKRSEGYFYYEAPDKGRIDIRKADIEGKVSERKNAQGEPYKLEADREERWLCTGTEVSQIDDAAKTVEVFPIPPSAQGQNIMDGPLPFLFGMPAEKAKLRFKLTLLKETADEAWIQAIPRMQQDAQNYSKATIILSKKNGFVPRAVQLLDPAGNLETVYTFSDLAVNKPKALFNLPFIGGKDPFNPDLKGYRLVANRAVPPANVAMNTAPGAPANGIEKVGGVQQPAGMAVPALIGLNWKEAQTIVEKLGLKCQFKRGNVADRNELIHVVYQQDPAPRTAVQPGAPVTLVLYTDPAKQASK